MQLRYRIDTNLFKVRIVIGEKGLRQIFSYWVKCYAIPLILSFISVLFYMFIPYLLPIVAVTYVVRGMALRGLYFIYNVRLKGKYRYGALKPV